MTDPYCNRCGTPHQAGHCGRDNAMRTHTDDDPRTDGLRDRIFKALYDNCNLPEHRCRDLADAVIRQVGLEKEFGCRTAAHHGCRCSYRHVTEWITEVNDAR